MLLTAVLVNGACASSERIATVATTIDSSAGYPIYRHSGEPVEWSAELIMTVGADTGGVYEFGQVRSIVLDSNGSLYVLDPTIAQVSVFNSAGKFVGTRGRKGRGPGEFVSPQSVALLHDSLLVFAPFSRQLVQFAPGGEWVRDVIAPAPAGPTDLLLYRTPPDGFWMNAAFLQNGGILRAFIRYPTTSKADTIVDRRPVVTGWPPISCSVRGGFSIYQVPFSPTGFSRPVGNGVQALVISSEYRITFVAPSGDTLRVLERAFAPYPISDAEWNRETARFQLWRESRGYPPCTRDELDRPSTRPPFEWMFVDDQRRLWVETSSSEGSVYEVFEQDGSLVASVAGLPPSQGVDPSVARGRIALYAPDTNSIPRVQVFRIVQP